MGRGYQALVSVSFDK